jgi:hypothetical protein
MTNKLGQIRFRSIKVFLEKKSRARKKEYPQTPHTGTGTSNKIEYGLCDTVSQLMDREIAQKLS